MSDLLKKYLFPDHATRAQAVKLSQAWQSGLAHQKLPEAVRNLLGELVSAAVLLASNLKIEGTLILQLQGDGPVALIVVECSSDLIIRATATLKEDGPHTISPVATLQDLLNVNGQGRCSVVLEPTKKTPSSQTYQGVVPLEGDTVAAVLEAYMKTSEQLETRFWLAANAHNTAGLLLQRLPEHTETPGNTTHSSETESSWERAQALAATLQPDELLTLDTDTVIHRLFWQENLLTFDAQTIVWSCPCTRERVGNMLRMLGADEINDILSERQQVDVSCNFCGKPYQFDAIDCARLFHQPSLTPQPDSDSIH